MSVKLFRTLLLAAKAQLAFMNVDANSADVYASEAVAIYWESYPRKARAVSHPHALVRRIAKNLFRKRFRSVSRRREVENAYGEQVNRSESDPADRMIRAENSDLVQSLLAEYASRPRTQQRTIDILQFWLQGFDPYEIVDILELGDGGKDVTKPVRSAISRFVRFLNNNKPLLGDET